MMTTTLKTATNGPMRELTEQELDLVGGGDTAKSGGTTTSGSSGSQTTHPVIAIIAILIG